MRARSLHLIVSAALMLPVCAALSAGALAQAPAPAANPQLAAAQASFESLPEAERRAIQADLIWSGHFNGAVSGSYGPLTFRAINAFKAGKGAPDGLLTPAERRSLAQSAQAAREAAGFRVIADERTGLRIGIPAAVLPKRDVSPSGSRWQSADGKITLDTSATPPGETLEAVYEKATAPTPNNPGRKITYKLLRPDFFVVTGETPTGKFYRRLASGPSGLRGFSIGYDKALAASVDKLVIAIAASFELRAGPFQPSPKWTFSPYGFFDIAHTSDQDRGGFNQTVKSVGVGFQMPVRERWVLDVSYARPLDKRAFDRSKPPGRLLVNFTARFF